MGNNAKRFRMDFISKVIAIDEKTRTVTFSLEPDPRRYEWQEKEGKRFLFDKLDRLLFPEEVFWESMKNLKDLPIYGQENKIGPGKAEAYIDSRNSIIKNMFDGTRPRPTFEDKSDDFLQSLAVDELAFVILSIDIVGSTNLAGTLKPEIYKKLIYTTLYELSEIIPKFHGYVLKYTGDGFIAYFPEPSFINKNDLAIDCALTLRGLVYRALNPILKERDLPAIDIRIGLDAGEAYVETIGSPGAKQHKDIIGAIVNMATKIQALAEPGKIYLGNTVVQNLHVMWRHICEPVYLAADWTYRNAEGNLYKVYRVKTNSPKDTAP
jgi:class 3 adenylate cyclase